MSDLTIESNATELRSMRDEVFEQISALALAHDKTKAQPLIRRFWALAEAYATAVPEPDTSKYGRYKRAREAILDSLDEIGHAVEQEVIVEDLISNGFRRGKKDADKDVRKAIGFHVQNPRGIASKIIRSMNDKIGRFEWPDEKF